MNRRLLVLLSFFSLISNPLIGEWKRESMMEPWGIDSTLAKKNQSAHSGINYSVGVKTCEKMILFFQKNITQIDGPRSHFYPTSSSYTLQAIRLYGVLNGIGLGCDRLLRENGEQSFYHITNNYGSPRKVNPVPQALIGPNSKRK